MPGSANGRLPTFAGSFYVWFRPVPAGPYIMPAMTCRNHRAAPDRRLFVARTEGA